jgi:nicotinate-nucleotide adenylyltransferase
MSKLGIIGGSFDPPHYAHLAIAEEAWARLGLAQVLFAPAFGNPLKHGNNGTAAEHRLRMVELAIADNPHFAVTTLDLQPGPSYTVNLLERLHAEYPTAELHFIIGYDALRQLAKWYQAARVLELARMVAFPRPGAKLNLAALTAILPAAAQRIQLIEDGPLLDISASNLRQRAAAGLTIRYQTPDAVIKYIGWHRLYSKQLPQNQKPHRFRPRHHRPNIVIRRVCHRDEAFDQPHCQLLTGQRVIRHPQQRLAHCRLQFLRQTAGRHHWLDRGGAQHVNDA